MTPKKPLFDFPQSMAPRKPLFDQQPELEESSTFESSSEEEESLSNKHLSTPEGDTVEESSDGVEESSEEGESEGEGEKDEPKVSEVVPIVEKQQTILPSQSPADSGGGGGEEEESEKSLDSPSASDFRIKPIRPTKPTSKNSKSISKRPLEVQKDDEKDSRGKKKPKVNAEELKKDLASGGTGRCGATRM